MSNEKKTGLFDPPPLRTTPTMAPPSDLPAAYPDAVAKLSPDLVNLTDAERSLIVTGLSIHLCLIETGDPAVRAADVEAWGDDRPRNATAKIKALTLDRMRVILAAEEIIAKLQRR